MMSRNVIMLGLLVVMITGSVGATPPVAITDKADRPKGDMSWWYRQPGRHFWEGMPIGTGRLGAMVWGQVRDEVINLNDETLWSGGPYSAVREGGLEALPEIEKSSPIPERSRTNIS